MSRHTIEGLTPEQRIERALDSKGPYTSNIISCILRSVAQKEGNAEANELIDMYGLESMGYKKEKVNDKNRNKRPRQAD